MTKVARDTVVFDLGGVLIEWNPRHLYRKLFAGDEAVMEHFPIAAMTRLRPEARNCCASALRSAIRTCMGLLVSTGKFPCGEALVREGLDIGGSWALDDSRGARHWRDYRATNWYSVDPRGSRP